MTTTSTTSTTSTSSAAGGQPHDPAALHAALVGGVRPPRPSAARASATFGWRALLRIKHVPEQLFDVTAFPVITTLMFTYLFGGALAGSVSAYVQYFLPGVLVQTVVMITMYTGVALNTDREKGVFDRFRSLPVWHPSAMVGALLGDAVRFTLASTIVVVLGVVLGFRPDAGVAGVLAGVALLLVFAFSLGWAWTYLGLVLRTPNSVMGTSMMVLFPLTFGSNIFVDPATMPGWLEAVVGVNPISHLATGVRGLMHGTADGGDVLLVLGWSALFVAVFGPLTMRRYGSRG
ncbi:ABC transporter permease [Vallicoccus soli]|uniref:Transport permease protein n=1 Tax=Vallicoccus soli TaxID=2339232 RepID=A0A3A3Z1B3_9ACTN|nr:ABC transporter permease [Vallicoccus soli]RJK94177.1 ABC transporter permease [Vallicoccus soli]